MHYKKLEKLVTRSRCGTPWPTMGGLNLTLLCVLGMWVLCVQIGVDVLWPYWLSLNAIVRSPFIIGLSVGVDVLWPFWLSLTAIMRSPFTSASISMSISKGRNDAFTFVSKFPGYQSFLPFFKGITRNLSWMLNSPEASLVLLLVVVVSMYTFFTGRRGTF